MTNTFENTTLHKTLAENYVNTSHSDCLILGHITSKTVMYCVLPLTAGAILDATELQAHKRGTRLRFNLNNRSFFTFAKKHNARIEILCSRQVFDKTQADTIREYKNVKEKAFNKGIIFERLISETVYGENWTYNAKEKPYYLASDIQRYKVQCKLSNASISESSILNAIKYFAQN